MSLLSLSREKRFAFGNGAKLGESGVPLIVGKGDRCEGRPSSEQSAPNPSSTP